ncbi:MAG: hypothetical protein J5I81_08055, partial [Nitrococcus mobilis]|nr:hypothetical protein [Nitrococcus mobilis]
YKVGLSDLFGRSEKSRLFTREKATAALEACDYGYFHCQRTTCTVTARNEGIRQAVQAMTRRERSIRVPRNVYDARAGIQKGRDEAKRAVVSAHSCGALKSLTILGELFYGDGAYHGKSLKH